MMKDSTIDPNWLREQMTKNPPSVRPSGDVFTGPVRLSFPNLFKPGKPSQDNPNSEGKYGTAMLFPPNTDMGVFEKAWLNAAKAGLPSFFDDQGRPVGLHSPFHDQAEKAFGSKPLAGYTPGSIVFSATSKYKAPMVDMHMNPIIDENRVYPGVWAFCVLNTYVYGVSPPRPKKGVGFGLQHVMIIGDDKKLGGGGGGDPKQAFGHVAITAASNVAAKFDNAPAQQHASPTAGIMPAGGHVGMPGHLPVHPIPTGESEDERMMREMMG